MKLRLGNIISDWTVHQRRRPGDALVVTTGGVVLIVDPVHRTLVRPTGRRRFDNRQSTVPPIRLSQHIVDKLLDAEGGEPYPLIYVVKNGRALCYEEGCLSST